MPKFAGFDNTKPFPSPVTGWYDTDLHNYANLPNAASLVPVSDAQWQARMAKPSGYSVAVDGTIIDSPPPIITFLQKAQQALASGLTVSITGTLNLDTVFPVDAVSQSKINSVLSVLNTTGVFPGGSDSYPMKDANGVWQTMTVKQYKAIAVLISAYASKLDMIIDGNPMNATVLPSHIVSITV